LGPALAWSANAGPAFLRGRAALCEIAEMLDAIKLIKLLKSFKLIISMI
jgi:hypothetical protein